MRPRRTRRASYLDKSVQRRHRPDYTFLVLPAALLAIGLIVVYAISPGLTERLNVSDNHYVIRQGLAILVGVVSFFVFAKAPHAWLRRGVLLFAVAAAAISLGVLLFGEEVNGATRWLQLGGWSFQAAELIKFALIMWLAVFVSDLKARGVKLDNWQLALKPVAIVLTVTVFTVAVLQSDLGSTAVMLAIVGSMLFVAGMPLQKFMLVLGGIAFIGFLAIASSPYRRDRVATFLNPEADCQNEGYQACQSLIAIGSGGVAGRGVGHSVQAYYVPEAVNDSIFAIYAEKFGFLGVSLLLGLFTYLFVRMKKLIETTADEYSRMLAVGILAWFSTQAIINIGAMMGLLPIKGITLPFVSYGGTSIVFVCAAAGVLFQLSRYNFFTSQLEEENLASVPKQNEQRSGHGRSRPRTVRLSHS